MGERDRLEIEKIKAETELLKKEIEAKSRHKSFRDIVVAVLPTIVTVITILAGLWGLYNKVDEYIVNQRLENEIRFDKEILGLVTNLNSDDEFQREYAALMLTSYDLNSVPVLLFILERSQYDNAIYVQTLRHIYKKESVDQHQFCELIIDSTWQLMLKDFERMEDINDVNIRGIVNHFEVFEELSGEFEKPQVNQLTELFDNIESKMNELQEKDEIDNQIVDIINTMIKQAKSGFKT